MSDPYGRGVSVHVAPRCWRCNRQLAVLLSEPYVVRCPRCKADNRAGEVPAGVPGAEQHTH